MSVNKSSLSEIEKLERELARLLPKDKNIIRRKKNGDIIYETVRTGAPMDNPKRERGTGPNFYTETPDSPQNGQQFDATSSSTEIATDPATVPEVIPTQEVVAPQESAEPISNSQSTTGISIHDDQTTGQQIATTEGESADPLEELLSRALSKSRRGRPAAFDEHNKGKLVALLSLGMSLRQAAAVLGVSHGTIRNTLKADPALAEEITAARFQAQLQPLACVIREARRSWKAATWLLKYLDAKVASHEETPDERRERQNRESEDFHARFR